MIHGHLSRTGFSTTLTDVTVPKHHKLAEEIDDCGGDSQGKK